MMFRKAIKYFGVNIYVILVFTFASAISLFLRHRASPVLTGDPLQILAADFDSPGHLRSFDLIIAKFPGIPSSFDYYSNYPLGLDNFFPPIWSYMLAAISILPSEVLNIEPVRIAGFLVLLLSVVAAVPVYFLAKELFGRDVALITSLIFLFHPAFFDLSRTGIDHHVADVVLVPSIFASFLVSLRFYTGGNTKAFVVSALIGGMFMTLSMLVSLSLLLINCMVLLPAAVAVFIMPKEKVEPAFASVSGLFGVAGSILVMLALFTPWLSGSIEFSRLSYLHIIVFIAISLFCGVGFVFLRLGIKQSVFEGIMFSAIVFGIGLILIDAIPGQILIKGFYRSIGSYPLGLVTGELRSFFNLGAPELIPYFSQLFFIAPIVIVALIIKDWKSKQIEFERLFFYSMLFVLGFYTVQAVYYHIYLSLFLVISYGLGIFWASHLLHDKLSKSGINKPGANILMIACTVMAVLIIGYSQVEAQTYLTNPNLMELARYIKENTPEPGDFLQPTKKPDYGLMCNWRRSFQFQYLAQRPTVGSDNQENGTSGIIASEKFYQTTSEEEGIKLLEKLGAKYVIGDTLFSIWAGDLSKIGEPSSDPDKTVRTLRQEELDMDMVEKTMAVRLSWDVLEHLPVGKKEPLHHFRLLFISDKDKELHPFLLYEVVKGAKIIVKDDPGITVSVQTNIQTNNKRTLVWFVDGRTGEDGIFSTVVPYPSEGSKALVKAERYKVKVKDAERYVDVEVEAVEKGDEIIVSRL